MASQTKIENLHSRADPLDDLAGFINNGVSGLQNGAITPGTDDAAASKGLAGAGKDFAALVNGLVANGGMFFEHIFDQCMLRSFADFCLSVCGIGVNQTRPAMKNVFNAFNGFTNAYSEATPDDSPVDSIIELLGALLLPFELFYEYFLYIPGVSPPLPPGLPTN